MIKYMYAVLKLRQTPSCTPVFESVQVIPVPPVLECRSSAEKPAKWKSRNYKRHIIKSYKRETNSLVQPTTLKTRRRDGEGWRAKRMARRKSGQRDGGNSSASRRTRESREGGGCGCTGCCRPVLFHVMTCSGAPPLISSVLTRRSFSVSAAARDYRNHG